MNALNIGKGNCMSLRMDGHSVWMTIEWTEHCAYQFKHFRSDSIPIWWHDTTKPMHERTWDFAVSNDMDTPSVYMCLLNIVLAMTLDYQERDKKKPHWAEATHVNLHSHFSHIQTYIQIEIRNMHSLYVYIHIQNRIAPDIFFSVSLWFISFVGSFLLFSCMPKFEHAKV